MTAERRQPQPGGLDSDEPQMLLDSAAQSVRIALDEGSEERALETLLAVFPRLQAMAPETLAPPPRIGVERWDALAAAGARFALRGRTELPGWTEARLEHPWFPVEGRGIMPDDYRAITIRRTPPEFAHANIFLGDHLLHG